PSAPTSSTRATWFAKARAEIQLLRLSRTELLADLFGVHRRVRGGAVAFAHQDSGGLVGPVAAATLNAHGHDHIRAEHADQANIISHDVLATPFRDDFLQIERIAVVDGAREVLF